MSNELPQQDKELIAKIDERLKHYKLITDNEQQAPVETDEAPVFWVSFKNVDGFNPKKIYTAKLSKGLMMSYNDYGHTYYFKTEKAIFHTYEEYIANAEILSNEAPVEWKVGEWAWSESSKTTLALITDFAENGKVACVDNQDGHTEKWDIRLMVKPTKEEVEQHLVKIAEKKYPVGAKVKPLWGDYAIWTVETHEFGINSDGSLYAKDISSATITTLWTPKRGWAEPITEQKERFDVDLDKINEDEYGIYITPISNKLSQAEAERAAQAIRETLKNL